MDRFITDKLDTFLKPFFEKEKKQTGVEFEFSIVNLNKKTADLKVLNKLNDFLVKEMNFEIIERNSFDHKPVVFRNKPSGDLISYECSYNTLEFSLEPDINILENSKRFYAYFEQVQQFLLLNDHILTGLGIHPFFEIIDTSPLNSDYYIQMYQFLAKAEQYNGYHSYVNFCSFTNAAQTQLDVDPQKLPEILSLLNKTAWISALLFSNSPLLFNKPKNIPDNFCTRDYFLDFSYFGFNSNYIGIDNNSYDNFDQIYKVLSEVPMTYAKRNDHFYFFDPIPFKDYFYKKSIKPIPNMSGENGVTIIPEDTDLEYFRPKKNISITKKGTIEVRQDCQLRPGESYSAAAFYTGILDVIPEVNMLLKKYDYKNDKIRQNIINDKFDDFTSKKEASKLILNILELIKQALEKRNFGEEKFLEPLFFRAEKLCSPAKENLMRMQNGNDIISVIKMNSK